MLFNISLFNHCEDGRRCIEDLVLVLSAQLHSLGHEVMQRDYFINDGINVLYESFADEGTIPRIAAAHKRGCRFLYIATEEPAADGSFNGRLDNAMRERMEAFPEAAIYAEGVLCLVPGEKTCKWYDQYAPSAYAELGYVKSLLSMGPIEPTRNFGFYGQLTPRRQRIFDR